MSKPVKSKAQHTWLDTFTMSVSVFVLGAFTVLSCYLNMVYAAGRGEDVEYHIALPLLALLAGIFAEFIFLSGVNKSVRWLTGTLVTIGFLTVMAASYLAVLGVARVKYPSLPVPLVAVIAAFPDGFMVIAATVTLALRIRRSRLRESSEPTTTKPTIRPTRGGFARRLAEAATARAEAALAVPTGGIAGGPKSQVAASTEVDGSLRGGTHGGLTEGDVALRGGLTEAPTEVDGSLRGGFTEGDVALRGAVRGGLTEARRRVRGPSTKPPTKASVEVIDPAIAEALPVAEELVASRVIARKTPSELAAVVAAIRRGETDNSIKSSGIASSSTAAKVRSALAEVDGRLLTSVG